MQSLSHHEITTFLLSIAVLLGSARLLGELAQRLGQPAVLGEILAGILLGPTALGAILPGVQSGMFPADGPVAVALHGISTLAITLFLLVAGMEVDLATVWRQGKAAFIVGAVGIVFPFAVGFVPAWLSPGSLGARPDTERLVFALFFATAMAITALPVIARILLDLNLFRSDVGVTIVAAAILNDLLGWIIFALVLGMMGGADAGNGLSVWQIALFTLLFTAFMLTAGRWVLNRVLPWIQAHTTWPGGILAFALCTCLLCAALTEAIGIHAIFGAFLFGVALGDSTHLRRRTQTTIEQFVSFIFAPLFFASIGLRVDFVRNFDLVLVMYVLLLATVGKVIGCGLAARWAGFGGKEARAIGFGMNARGAMEIILGLLALQAGIIGPRLFVALVIMALVTSMTSGALIQRSFGRRREVRFIDFVVPATFIASLQARDRQDAIVEVATAAAVAAGLDAAVTVDAVWRREHLASSGMGNSVAVPHARIEGLSAPVIAVGLCPPGIDFDSPDGTMARVIVLMLTPADDTVIHMAMLASVARTLHADYVIRRLLARVTNLTELRAFLNAEAPPHEADTDAAPATGAAHTD